jgi:hypothetical protein
MFFKNIHTLFFLLLAASCFAGNPAVRGNWKGYLVSKSLDSDNSSGLPVTLYIIDDNDAGDFQGEMTVQYRYQTDLYKAKYSVEGNIDYTNYIITLEQTNLIYYDILPKGLQWCFGGGTFNIYRSIYGKKIYMDGYLGTNCGGEKMRMILIKM